MLKHGKPDRPGHKMPQKHDRSRTELVDCSWTESSDNGVCVCARFHLTLPCKSGASFQATYKHRPSKQLRVHALAQ
eukprot:6479230-Amphidinium_carterae.1